MTYVRTLSKSGTVGDALYDTRDDTVYLKVSGLQQTDYAAAVSALNESPEEPDRFKVVKVVKHDQMRTKADFDDLLKEWMRSTATDRARTFVATWAAIKIVLEARVDKDGTATLSIDQYSFGDHVGRIRREFPDVPLETCAALLLEWLEQKYAAVWSMVDTTDAMRRYAKPIDRINLDVEEEEELEEDDEDDD